MKNQTSPLYQVMKNELVDAIVSGQLRAGSRVPSESELIARYEVSNTTARRCLDELEQQGYVRRVRGSGSFVSEMASLLRQQQVAVLIRDFETLAHPFISRVLSVIEKNVDGANIHLSIQRMPPLADLEAAGRTLLSSLQHGRSEFVLLLSSVPLAVVRPLADGGIKCLGVNVRYLDDRIPHLAGDFEAMFAKVFEGFGRLGHRRIAILAAETPLAGEGVCNSTSWIPSALEKVRARNPDLALEVSTTVLPAPATDHLAGALDQLVAKPDRPTALFCWNEGAGHAAVRHLRQRGVHIPEEMSVIVPEFLPSGDLAGIEMPFAAMATESAQALLDWSEGRRPKSQLFAPGRFLARGTVGPAPA